MSLAAGDTIQALLLFDAQLLHAEASQKILFLLIHSTEPKEEDETMNAEYQFVSSITHNHPDGWVTVSVLHHDRSNVWSWVVNRGTIIDSGDVDLGVTLLGTPVLYDALIEEVKSVCESNAIDMDTEDGKAFFEDIVAKEQQVTMSLGVRKVIINRLLCWAEVSAQSNYFMEMNMEEFKNGLSKILDGDISHFDMKVKGVEPNLPEKELTLTVKHKGSNKADFEITEEAPQGKRHYLFAKTSLTTLRDMAGPFSVLWDDLQPATMEP